METTEKTYWKSFEELSKKASYLKSLQNEFSPKSAEGAFPLTRKKFLSLLGASLALATTSCRRPVQKILPYVKQPENAALPGMAKYYASVFSLGNFTQGILVKTREGRPIKIEGNPDHPLSSGKTSTFAQASILDLYDPDRMKAPLIFDKQVSWKEWLRVTSTILKNAKLGNQKIRILAESNASPTLEKVFKEFLGQFGNAVKYEFEPVNQEKARSAFYKSFGTSELPKLHLDKAQVVLSLNSDFLGNQADSVTHIQKWVKNRKVRSTKDNLSRLFVVESSFSLTGTNADNRLALKPSELLSFSLNLLKRLVTKHGLTVSSQTQNLLQEVEEFKGNEYIEAFLNAAAEDLASHQGTSLVVVGAQESEELQIVGHLLNSVLNNMGKTVDDKVTTASSKNGYTSLELLLKELEAGQVDVLITVGGNPVYHLGKKFEAALSKARTTLRLSQKCDETCLTSQYVAPLSHYLEAWGDSAPETGVYSVHQPMIRPLYKTKSEGEIFTHWTKYVQGKKSEEQDWLAEIKNTSKKFDWKKLLHDGVALSAPSPRSSLSFRNEALNAVQEAYKKLKTLSQGTFELQFETSPHTYDGRWANHAWLLELPHPVTKITWDNVASMSPETAKELHVKQEDQILIEIGNQSAVLPVFIQAGLAEKVITTEIGFGRTASGRVGNNVGVNVYPLLQANEFSWAARDVKVSKVFGHYKIASTQVHHDLMGRPILFDATLEEYQKNPAFPAHEEHGELIRLYPSHKYEGHKWGMVIDMNSCVGCSACVVACDAENNVPVVGKAQVLKGREMQWMRIDRYYDSRNQYSPAVFHQPMLCQHCDDAPCETVCPVSATTHSDEGINQMTYNRCVGTRYCSNNCPYKVRRFNYFNFNYEMSESEKLVKNPDVTVRARGVMEKCTFCIQRINAGKNDPDHIVTACQQACPADAIVFGDVNNKDSEVFKLSKLSHGFHVLRELNTLPAITYLAKVRNPHPQLIAFEKRGTSTHEPAHS
ncbi:MAG TPA: TAT-variant-translocated molybdopterin oxidoreductase [Bdellovibrionota bacterium]|nr:TAT-variant-translocated molybdopterin oxidoreductase [Bdellovibrionota bacterium]